MDNDTLRDLRTKLIAISAVLLSGVGVYFFYVDNPEPSIVPPEPPAFHESANRTLPDDKTAEANPVPGDTSTPPVRETASLKGEEADADPAAKTKRDDEEASLHRMQSPPPRSPTSPAATK